MRNKGIVGLDRIVVDPDVLVGKPVVKGTRISVELVLEHLADTPDINDLLEAYPHLAVEDVQACLEYARSVVAGEMVFPTSVSTSRRRAE